MHEVNLSAEKIWLFSDSSGDPIRLTLPDVLLSDVPLYHSPTPGYLIPIQQELLASILQIAVDTLWPKGIRKKDYSKLILSERTTDILTLVRPICVELEEMAGFSLTGTGAFLQMPTAWRKFGKKMNIARLVWPFIPNIHGTVAKGIRRMNPVPTTLGADLTALFLYTSCTLPEGGTNYWTIGNLAGRALQNFHQGKTLRQRLFCSVLPGYSQFWQPLQPLPWMPKCLNNGGLETNNRPPFSQYLVGAKKLKGTGNIRFYQARAIVLDPPEPGICAISGEQTTVFTSYRLLIDKEVHRQILSSMQPRKEITSAGILGRIYIKKDHPSVTGSNRLDDTTKDFELSYHGFSKPSWSIVNYLHTYPSQIMQTVTPFLRKDNTTASGEISFLLIKYAARKQDVRGIYQYYYSGSRLIDASEEQLITFLTEITEQSIKKLTTGLLFLLARKNNRRRRKKTDKEMVDDFMLHGSQHLWNTADQILHTSESEERNIERWKNHVEFHFQQEIMALFLQFLKDYWESGSLSLNDRQQEHYATSMTLGENYMYADLPYLDANQVVRAGRAFAKTYQGLGSQKKAQLLNERALYLSRHFWTCMNNASREDPGAYQPMYEQIIPLLAHIQPRENGKNLGEILACNNRHVKSRRVELLLSETDREMLIDGVLQVFRIIAARNGRPVPLDVGVFCYDLTQFHFSPSKVVRQWASNYFAYTFKHDRENYVQT